MVESHPTDLGKNFFTSSGALAFNYWLYKLHLFITLPISQFPRFGQYCRVQYGRIPECSDWLLPWGSYAIPSLSIVFKNEFTH